MIMPKLHQVAENYYAFHCPGCQYGHAVTVNGHKNSQGASWGWNGSMDKPTFTPSINCNAGDPHHQCHSFVNDGRIQFLGDCFHTMKGQTVEIPDWDEDDSI
jgi:hypothetical protein